MAVFALGGWYVAQTRGSVSISSQLTQSSTCIISILRLQSLYVVSVSPDITWDNPLPAIWSSSEVNVGIICSCLPTLKGGIVRIFPRLFPAVSSANRQSGRQTRTIGGSEPDLQRPERTAKAFELLGSDKSQPKSHRRTWESEESLREVETYQQLDETHEHGRRKNYSWLHDASSTEDTASRASRTGTQYSEAPSSYKLV